jgi:transcriptional regulator with XRE-family HTH domain
MSVFPQSSNHRFSRKTALAGLLLGKRVQIARLRRQWPESEAAERANISRMTLRKVEKGDLGVMAGAVFSLCTLLEVPIIGEIGEAGLEEQIRIADLELAALPRRIRETKVELQDDF